MVIYAEPAIQVHLDDDDGALLQLIESIQSNDGAQPQEEK